MDVKVKICGLRTPQALDAALEAGADYVGFVFYGPSPRNVDMDNAKVLADTARGRAQTVALLVDPEDDQVKQVVDTVNPDIIQLHGNESPERVEEVRTLAARPVMKAIKVATREDVQSAQSYDGKADMILYDAKVPEDATDMLPGGNGMAFDWQALLGVKKPDNFILSGGLDPDNVRGAIEQTGAEIVDVSSGVESAPGEKDPVLIRQFVAAVKGR